MEDEEKYLGQLLSEFVVTWAKRLQACRRRIESIVKVEALVCKMNGKKPYWVRCDAKGRPIGLKEIHTGVNF
jgi:hypothetical protein